MHEEVWVFDRFIGCQFLFSVLSHFLLHYDHLQFKSSRENASDSSFLGSKCLDATVLCLCMVTLNIDLWQISFAMWLLKAAIHCTCGWPLRTSPVWTTQRLSSTSIEQLPFLRMEIKKEHTIKYSLLCCRTLLRLLLCTRMFKHVYITEVFELWGSSDITDFLYGLKYRFENMDYFIHVLREAEKIMTGIGENRLS